jgi:hypothetical protein
VFTARPGPIKTDSRSTCRTPRHYTVKTTPRFAEYKAALTESIRAEVLQTMAEQATLHAH